MSITLAQAADSGKRVEVTFDDDDWGWPSSVGPMNPVRGYIGRTQGPWKVFILLRLKSSISGYAIDDQHIKEIRYV